MTWRSEPTDSANVRSVIRYLGGALVLALGAGAWLAYVLSTRAKDTLPDAIVPLLTALGTITGVIAGQLGSLLARTSTAPVGATNNIVNAAPQGDPPSPTVNTTNIGGPPDGGAAVTFTGDAPGVVPLG